MLRKRLEETIRKFLAEVSVKQLKQQYPESEKIIDGLASKVENKYFEFIMKLYSRNKSQDYLQKIVDKVGKYEKFSKLKKIDAFLKDSEVNTDGNDWIKNPAVKDINFFYKKAQKEKMDPLNLLDTFLSIVEQYKTKGEEKKETKQSVKKIYEDSNILILSPRSREASCFYGKGTKWCISAEKNNAWESYMDKNAFFVFIFNKSSENDDKQKVAVAFYPFPNTKIEVYDAADEKLKLQNLLDYYGEEKFQLIFGNIRNYLTENGKYKYFFFIPGDVIKYKGNPEKIIKEKSKEKFQDMMFGKINKEQLTKEFAEIYTIKELFFKMNLKVGDILKRTESFAKKFVDKWKNKISSEELKKGYEKVINSRYKIFGVEKDKIIIKDLNSGKEIEKPFIDEKNYELDSNFPVEDMLKAVKRGMKTSLMTVKAIGEKYFDTFELGPLSWENLEDFELVEKVK